jgi:hypothetical protein
MKKKKTIKEAQNFLDYVHNLCKEFAYEVEKNEDYTIYYFSGGFKVSTHGASDNLLIYSVYCKFNDVHPEIEASNQYSGKFNFLSTSSLEFSKLEFKEHFQTLLNTQTT